MSHGLTVPQSQMLEEIRLFRHTHDFAPTIRELMDRLGYTNTQAVANHLLALRAKGFIDWVDHAPRTITIEGEADWKENPMNIKVITDGEEIYVVNASSGARLPNVVATSLKIGTDASDGKNITVLEVSGIPWEILKK